ncbi:MAG: ACT domain-containing protein [Synergistaceae bacterium]|nr:ACT domain-containing protein [Synergistaceae bacterium]
MTVKQISVFLENKPGQLSDVTKVLAEKDIDMRALSLAEAAEFGIVRLIVSDPEGTAKALKDAGYICALTPVIAAAVPDRPGGLYSVLELLRTNDINLEYAYVFIAKKKDGAYNIFHVADSEMERAMKVLAENGVTLVEQEELDSL